MDCFSWRDNGIVLIAHSLNRDWTETVGAFVNVFFQLFVGGSVNAEADAYVFGWIIRYSILSGSGPIVKESGS